MFLGLLFTSRCRADVTNRWAVETSSRGPVLGRQAVRQQSDFHGEAQCHIQAAASQVLPHSSLVSLVSYSVARHWLGDGHRGGMDQLQ